MGTNFSSLLFSIDRQLTLTPLLHVVTQDMVFGWIVSCYKEVAVCITPLSRYHPYIFFSSSLRDIRESYSVVLREFRMYVRRSMGVATS